MSEGELGRLIQAAVLDSWRLWRPIEPLRMLHIGGQEGRLPGCRYFPGPAVMEIFWSEQSDSRMVVLLVVPVEKRHTEGSGVFDGTKTGRKLRPIL